jgi:hypothetical protein
MKGKKTYSLYEGIEASESENAYNDSVWRNNLICSHTMHLPLKAGCGFSLPSGKRKKKIQIILLIPSKNEYGGHGCL